MITSDPGAAGADGDLIDRIARSLLGSPGGAGGSPASAATQSGVATAGFGPTALALTSAPAPGVSAPGVPAPDGVYPLGVAPDAPPSPGALALDAHGALPYLGDGGQLLAGRPAPIGVPTPGIDVHGALLPLSGPFAPAGALEAPDPFAADAHSALPRLPDPGRVPIGALHAPDPPSADAASALPRLPADAVPSPSLVTTEAAPRAGGLPEIAAPDAYFLAAPDLNGAAQAPASTWPGIPAAPDQAQGAAVARAPAPAATAPVTTDTLSSSTEAFDPTSADVHGALPRLHDFDPTPASAPVPHGLPAPVTPDFYFLTPSSVTALPAEPVAAVAEPTPLPRSLYAPVAETPPPLGSAISRRPFDVAEIRRDFPILEERVHGKRLVWLDNAATTHKPTAVLDRMRYYYEHEYSNVHRAAHTLAARSTDAYEAAREKVARFLHASSPSEIVFVRGTTEGVNLVANSWGRKNLVAGDEIILSTLEHHSNIVPWQFLAEATGAKLRVIPVTDRGEVLLSDYGKLLGPRTRLVAVTHVSNALGTILPVREITAAAHRHGATVLIDGAQAVSHFPVDVQEIGADFYVLSGHKLFAPTGVGAVYGKKSILDEMDPWQGGGNMIDRVTFERSTFADAPMRFEAGTATLADAVGLGAAVDYLERLGMDNVARHEHDLLAYATHELSRIGGVRLIGTAPNKAGVVSFIADGIPAEEFGKMLDQDGIAVRAGHHCAQPTMDRFGVTSTVRPSLALYNDHGDVDALVRSVRRILVQTRGRHGR